MREVARWAGVVVLIIASGFVGLIPLFSDSPSIWINIVEIVVIFFAAGLLIGFLHPRQWWVAGFAAWPGFLLLAAGLLSDRQFRDAPVLTVSVGDGYIRTASDTIYVSDIRLVQRNGGSRIHAQSQS